MSLTALTVLSTEAAGSSHKWEIGAATLAILLALMLFLVIFGGGREHS